MLVSTEFRQTLDEMNHTIAALNAVNGMMSYMSATDNLNMEDFYFLMQLIIDKQQAIQDKINTML